MKEYRRIWEAAFGPIPCDDDGRSYEIHHIDGNRGNNILSNLKCVSIYEHFLIHLRQGDMLAAAAVARRMGSDLPTLQLLNAAAGREARDKLAGFHGLSEAEKTANAVLGGHALKGMRWFNNGSENIRRRSCPHGYKPGKLPCGSGMSKGTQLGLFWNKDGVNKRSNECPGDGWTRGRHLTTEQREVRRTIARRQVSREVVSESN